MCQSYLPSRSKRYFTNGKLEYSVDNDLNSLPGNLDAKAGIEKPYLDVEEGQFLHTKEEPDESVDLEDGETDDESSIAIDLSHLSVNVSIVNSTFSDCGETTLSANDTLIERLELEDSQGDASYQVDQVSIDFDDSEIVVYIDEDSLSSADEAIEPASTKESVATAQKDFAEEHETLKLDATVNANENAMTSLRSEENEGNTIETVDSRLGGAMIISRRIKSAT